MLNLTAIKKTAVDLVERSMKQSPNWKQKISEDIQQVILAGLLANLGPQYDQEERAEFERGMKKAWAQFNSQFE